MKKKFLSLLLGICMVVTALPQMSFVAAVSASMVCVAGTDVSAGGYWLLDNSDTVTIFTKQDSKPSDNYIYYDKESSTLTLHNATINCNGKEGDINSGIYVRNGGLTIHLEGTNTITKTDGGNYCNAIYAAPTNDIDVGTFNASPLTITAENGASLTATA